MARRKKQDEVIQEIDVEEVTPKKSIKNTSLQQVLKNVLGNQNKIQELELKIMQLTHLTNRIHTNETNIRKIMQDISTLRELLSEQMNKIEKLNSSINLISERQAGRTFILDTDRKHVYELEIEVSKYKELIDNISTKLAVMETEHGHHKKHYERLDSVIQDISTDLRHIGKSNHIHDTEFAKIKGYAKMLGIIGTVISFLVSTFVAIISFFVK